MNCFRGRLYDISFSRLLLGAGESRAVLFTSLTFVTGKSYRYATNMTLSQVYGCHTATSWTLDLQTRYKPKVVQTGSQRNKVMHRACILLLISINISACECRNKRILVRLLGSRIEFIQHCHYILVSFVLKYVL